MDVDALTKREKYVVEVRCIERSGPARLPANLVRKIVYQGNSRRKALAAFAYAARRAGTDNERR